ncbi:hypothetical protein MMC17_005651 [Xylographa soralifera]|nr:hypothetical protein [Xylographa soralifera]
MANTQRMMKGSKEEIEESLEELLSEFRTSTMESRRGSAVSASGSAPGELSRSARGSSSAAEEIPRHTAFPAADSRVAAAAELFAPRVRHFERPLLSEQARAVDMAILGVTSIDDVVDAPMRRRRGRGRGRKDNKNDLVSKEKEKGVEKEKGTEQKKGKKEGAENIAGQGAKGSKRKAHVNDEELVKKLKAGTVEVPKAQSQAPNRPAVDRRAPPGRVDAGQHPQNAPTGPRQAQHRPYERQPIFQMPAPRQPLPQPPGFVTDGLAISQAVPGAHAPVGPANNTSLVNRAIPEHEWRARYDANQRDMQRRDETFVSHLDIERRNRQRKEAAERQERQAREDAERRQRQTKDDANGGRGRGGRTGRRGKSRGSGSWRR